MRLFVIRPPRSINRHSISLVEASRQQEARHRRPKGVALLNHSDRHHRFGSDADRRISRAIVPCDGPGLADANKPFFTPLGPLSYSASHSSSEE